MHGMAASGHGHGLMMQPSMGPDLSSLTLSDSLDLGALRPTPKSPAGWYVPHHGYSIGGSTLPGSKLIDEEGLISGDDPASPMNMSQPQVWVGPGQYSGPPRSSTWGMGGPAGGTGTRASIPEEASPEASIIAGEFVSVAAC
jgi:hypothetical protein